MTLPSNVINSFSNQNTSANFTVEFADKLVFNKEEWEVGLSEIFIPSHGYNMTPPVSTDLSFFYNALVAREHYTRRLYRVRIPPGRYTPKEYVRTVNELVEQVETEELVIHPPGHQDGEFGYKKIHIRSRLRFDEPSKKIVFVVHRGEGIQIESKTLRRMLGLQEDAFHLSHLGLDGTPYGVHGKRRFIPPRPADFSVNGTTMMVYCDIVRESPVGGSTSNLLRTVHLETLKSQDTLHREFRTISFYPLRHSILDKVHIRMCNAYGEDMRFHAGESSVVLMFRRRKKAAG